MRMHEPALDILKATHTLSCSSSSFCSKTIISDFPCCAARKLKNRLHLTRTSENWSCSNTERLINDQIVILFLNNIVLGLAGHKYFLPVSGHIIFIFFSIFLQCCILCTTLHKWLIIIFPLHCNAANTKIDNARPGSTVQCHPFIYSLHPLKVHKEDMNLQGTVGVRELSF